MHACPRCRLSLSPRTTHGVNLLGCPQCGGVFLEPGALGHVLKAKDEAFQQSGAIPESSLMEASPHSLPCPSCGKTMQTLQIGGVHVDVDRCNEHGTWFDRSELTSIRAQMRQRAGLRPESAAVAAGTTAAAAVALSASPPRANSFAGDAAQTMVEVGTEVAIESAIEGANAMGEGAEVAGAAVEAAGGALEFVVEALGEILSG